MKYASSPVIGSRAAKAILKRSEAQSRTRKTDLARSGDMASREDGGFMGMRRRVARGEGREREQKKRRTSLCALNGRLAASPPPRSGRCRLRGAPNEPDRNQYVGACPTPCYNFEACPDVALQPACPGHRRRRRRLGEHRRRAARASARPIDPCQHAEREQQGADTRQAYGYPGGPGIEQ